MPQSVCSLSSLSLFRRKIKLTLPEFTLRGSSDLQELLADMELPALLGKGADLSKISDANLSVGKVQYTSLAFNKYASCSVSASLTVQLA